MRCKCCDTPLSDKEIVWNEELQDWELCSVCLDISLDAAFSEGFRIDCDGDTELPFPDEEIPQLIDNDWDSRFESVAKFLYPPKDKGGEPEYV